MPTRTRAFDVRWPSTAALEYQVKLVDGTTPLGTWQDMPAAVVTDVDYGNNYELSIASFDDAWAGFLQVREKAAVTKFRSIKIEPLAQGAGGGGVGNVSVEMNEYHIG